MKMSKIAEFLKESVEWLVENQMGCCRYKLDDHLAIFVGWSAGYDEEKDDALIQAKDDPTYAINAGIKVWTSDDMWTDYDYLNFPYEKDGDVLDMGSAISPNEDYESVAKYLLDEYKQAKEFDMTDDGLILPREVEYDVVCFDRTLKIKFSKGSNIENKDDILKSLDKYYDAWQNDDDPTYCLEEFMVNEVCDEFDLCVEEWDSIPYGGNEEREHLWVCGHCLMGIESHEGNQSRLAHGVDEMDAIESRCDWCHECGFDTLYELV
jgi:hypothetical protein